MTEAELDDLLSTPRQETAQALAACPGDVMILGAGGKMGPTLARMVARAASDRRRVMAASRWSSPAAEEELARHGVTTIRCDLLDQRAVAALPDAPNVIFMAGQKFGTMDNAPQTWAVNAFLPGVVATRFPASRTSVWHLIGPNSSARRNSSAASSRRAAGSSAARISARVCG